MTTDLQIKDCMPFSGLENYRLNKFDEKNMEPDYK